MYHAPDQTGRRFIITGANSGTGLEATRRLAVAGASVLMAVRNLEKGEAARAEILTQVPKADLELGHVDLADLANVREFAAGVIADKRPVNVLVNNAGVMNPPKRIETVDGFELQFGSNFLGPFLLTNLLVPKLLEADLPRVTTMSSFVANFGSIRFEDLQWTRGYQGYRAYAQSKLADMLFALRLAEIATEREWPLISTLAHPGYTRTNLQSAGANLAREPEKAKKPVKRTITPSQEVEIGAEPLLFAAADPGAENGAYYGPNRVVVGTTIRARIPRSAHGVDLPASVWAVAHELTGLDTPL